MTCIILSNLQVILFYLCPIVERFKKVFMHCFAMGNIIVYYTTITLNILNKVVNCIKLRIV